MKILLGILVSISAFASEVPAFHVNVGLDPASKVPRWLVEILPPAAHHFNLKAPMDVIVESKKIHFQLILSQKKRIGFSSSDINLREMDQVSSSLFLCDDANTYCLKKSASFELKVNSKLKELRSSVLNGVEKKESAVPKELQKKDSNGFWVNAPEAAIAEAKRTGKPILIDFFGIWCPPCNLYEETVFNKKEFKSIARSFVLLKLDADRESSFALKSHFGIGGYPTLVVTTVPSADQNLSEVGRVVGFYPASELSKRLDSFLKVKSESLEARVSRSRVALIQDLKALFDTRLEQKDFEGAAEIRNMGLGLDATDLEMQWNGVLLRFEAPQPFQWTVADSTLLSSILEKRNDLPVKLIFSVVDSVLSHSSQVPVKAIESIQVAINALFLKLDAKTLRVPGVECNAAEIEAFRMDLAARLGDHANEGVYRKKAIEAYEKIIALQNGNDSRGLNLELAALLAKEGQDSRVRDLYGRFIAKYPHEFTFYFAAARFELEKNELKTAREHIEKAVQYAYGDHLIRSMERLVRVMKAQGESDLAKKRGEAFLNQFKIVPSLKVRTTRYLNQLKVTLDDSRKESTLK